MEIKKVHFFKILRVMSVVSFFIVLLSGCGSGGAVKLITAEELPSTDNVLMKKIHIACNRKADIWVRYWEQGNTAERFATAVSQNKKEHTLSLVLLKPATAYAYEIVTRAGKTVHVISEEPGQFKTEEIPPEIREMITPAEIQDRLPESFLKGYTLLARRDLPGQMYLVNAKGRIVWYHTIKNAGFKVAHFTKRSTVLSIAAPLTYPTSYGNEILEISLAGDTVVHLKKGEKGFDKTIHHELFYNDRDQLVTLTLEKKAMDLSRVGGAKADTVTGDGILILDRNGNAVWHWSVFDVLDPLNDPQILKDKADWLHANSLSIDTDGNYLLSFYLSGQLWKINAKNGQLIWKLGRGGDYTFPGGGMFSEAHAAYRSSQGQLMLFENGTHKQQSRVLVYTLDEQERKAWLNRSIELPPYLYSERMGSAYRVSDSGTLVCSAQAQSVSLLDNSGKILWRVRTGFIPYRAEFIDRLAL